MTEIARKRVDWRLLAIIVGLAVAAFFVFTTNSIGDNATLVTASGNHRIAVEIADTPQTRETGLMHREELAEGSGMLFDFREIRPVSMWMRNTLIPLDMLFVRENGTIARIARNAVPLDLTPIPSGEPVRYVLEIPGGAADAYATAEGDRLIHPIIVGQGQQ